MDTTDIDTDTTQRTDDDRSISNGDLLTDEVTADGDPGEGPADRPGADGLETVAPDLPPPADGPESGEAVPDLTGLPDVSFASDMVSAALPETVLGDDERVRISPASSFPWNAHASLRITARDGSGWIGTAFLVSPRVLLTAGHCVFIHSANASRHGWVRSIDVMAGRDGSQLPFGSVRATRFYSVQGWTGSRNDEYDYGAIVLNQPLVGPGCLGYAAYSDATLTSSVGNLSGYPGDLGGGTQQWYMARRIHSVGTRKLFYEIDTAGGQSGSAVYRISGGRRYVMGIHAYGVGAYPRNSATRITRPVFDNIRGWVQAHP